MNIVLVLLVIAITAALLWRLVKDIADDGRGYRPPPPSHYSDLEVGSARWWVDVWSGIGPQDPRRRLEPRH